MANLSSHCPNPLYNVHMGKLAQIRKNALLGDIRRTRSDLLEAAGRVPAELRTLTAVDGYSVLEVLARLTGWDDANFQAVDAVRAGHLPDFYAYAERGWSTFNDKLAQDYASMDYAALVTRVRSSQQRLLDVVDGLPPEDLERDYGVRFKKTKITISRLLRAQMLDEQALIRTLRALSALTPNPSQR